MAVNGVEIKVGQKWKTREGQEVEVIGNDGDWTYPWDLSNGFCVTNQGQVWQYEEDVDDLITLIQDEHGFTPWSGGECPVSDSTVVEYRMKNDTAEITNAGKLEWEHENNSADIIAYRVVKQEEEKPKQKKEITVETATEHKEEPKYTVKEVFDAINTETDSIAPFSSIEKVQKHLARLSDPDYNLYLQLKAKFE